MCLVPVMSDPLGLELQTIVNGRWVLGLLQEQLSALNHYIYSSVQGKRLDPALSQLLAMAGQCLWNLVTRKRE